jgi:hypothetical protein
MNKFVPLCEIVWYTERDFAINSKKKLFFIFLFFIYRKQNYVCLCFEHHKQSHMFSSVCMIWVTENKPSCLGTIKEQI